MAPKKHKGDRKHLKDTTGFLKKMIGFKSKRYGKRNNKKVIGFVGPKLGKLFNAKGKEVRPYSYAHLLERGTASHTVSPRAKEKLKSFAGPIQPNRFKSWTHPGAKAKAFMAPALKAVGPEIFERFTAKVKEILQTLGVKKTRGPK